MIAPAEFPPTTPPRWSTAASARASGVPRKRDASNVARVREFRDETGGKPYAGSGRRDVDDLGRGTACKFDEAAEHGRVSVRLPRAGENERTILRANSLTPCQAGAEKAEC